MSVKSILAFLVCALLFTLLGAACAAPAPSGPAAATQAPAPAAATKPAASQAAAKQELVIAATADSYTTEVNRSNLGMYPVNANIYDTLVRLTPDYQVEPRLATKWEFRSPNTWRFTLRQGVKFQDGSALDAEAVKWTMSRVAKIGGGTLGVGEDSVQVVDDLTVDITPKRPNLRLVQQLVHPNWSIIAPGTEPATKTIGTGPFKLVEYVKGDHLTVERFADYWGEKPKLDRITFKFVPDPNTRVLSLQSGDVQLAYEVPREAAKDVAKYKGLKTVTSQVGAYEALYVNIHGKPPYDLGQDPAVRQALAYAIDKASIVQNVWQGNAEPSQTMIPASILGKSAGLIKGTSFDPARARQILDAAGWKPGPDGIRAKDGRRLSLTMIVGFPSADIHRPMPEFVQAQLKDVGIELKIVQTPDNPAYTARLKSGEGDLWAEAGSQNDANPCFLPDLLFYSKGAGGEPSDYGRLFAPGAQFDKFIDGCRSAVEPADVQKNAAEAMRVLVDEEFVVIPLAGTYRIWGLSDKVQGFVPHPSGVNQRWETVWLGP